MYHDCSQGVQVTCKTYSQPKNCMSDRGSWTLSDADADMLCEARTQQRPYLKDLLQLARVLLCVHSHAVTAVAGRYGECVLRHPGVDCQPAHCWCLQRTGLWVHKRYQLSLNADLH